MSVHGDITTVAPYEIWTMRANGRDQRLLGPIATDDYADRLSWQPLP